jgi:serine protease Do
MEVRPPKSSQQLRARRGEEEPDLMSTDRSTARPARFWASAGLFVAMGLVLGLALAGTLRVQPVSMAQTPSSQMVNAAMTAPPLTEGESPFVAVVERAAPAVVSIDTKRKVGNAGMDGGGDDGDLFRRFFGDPQGGSGANPHRNMTVPASGSGFLIDRQGHILTNNHVVRDASEITVTLSDKRTFKAKVIGQDQATDVAVIQIQAGDDLPALPLGDSDRIKVGEYVMAIGNPLGELQGSVTAGIVSARGRSSLNIAGGAPDYQDFIQTDASINFGNSGGPLVNLRGEAIGINTAINAQGQGIGFAIPINLAKHIAEQLVATGKVVRGFLGVEPAELTPDLAASYGVAVDAGIVVQNVSNDSPASRAGIRRGDIITAFDGQRVHDVTGFRLRVADSPVDKHVAVSLLRDGKRSDVQVVLANRDVMLAQAPGRARGDRSPSVEGGDDPRAVAAGIGVTVRELNAREKEALGDDVKAVVVTDVAEGSPADEAGISEGELLLEANGKELLSPADLGAAVRQAKSVGRPMRVLLADVDWSSGRYQSRYVPVKLKD